MHIYIKSDPEFIPTWLYVKQHNRTKLKYLGKTRVRQPSRPLGVQRREVARRRHLVTEGTVERAVKLRLLLCGGVVTALLEESNKLVC